MDKEAWLAADHELNLETRNLKKCHIDIPYESLLEQLLLSHFSRVRLCATPDTAAHQAPPSLGFSRQEYWSGLPLYGCESWIIKKAEC